ncbi:MerR family transcriptional regulator [Paenibacillus lycopersici]|uniref:MerR family transcriptional regulator n=1 Tax=Paenibacillus lycopersici TaxID=2704462 RepID=A0A6C0FVU1_9BACL|nr:MerR family transcriptional regulator [Paenibacillus lycopersici]QHT59079.1 MerR family transcriptional regulator [Paenibacillus lycopersici]
MGAVKSKEAALALNVSQTTIKRWASYYPAVFRKDRFGHYLFNERDLELLGLIKAAIERGETMEQIKLPTPGMEQPRLDEAFLETAASSELLRTADDDMLTRILQVEQRLEQKADEVVNAQIRQHREELEELRRMIEQIAASIEYTRHPLTAMDELRKNEPKAPAAEKPRKRGLFRSMFIWF